MAARLHDDIVVPSTIATYLGDPMTPADPGATPSAPGVASHEREVEERWMDKGHGGHSRMEGVLSGEDRIWKTGTQEAGEGREVLRC